jgi:hypothetical protein
MLDWYHLLSQKLILILFFVNDISNCTAKLSQLTQSPCLKDLVNHAEFSMDLVLLKSVANARSTFPFCCGVPGAVNSNLKL